MPLTFRSLIVLSALLPASVATAGGIGGVARVIDGDTLEVGGQKIRLHGVDAPELDQTCTGPDGVWACGAFARDMLAGIVGEAQLDCRAEDTDRYGRIVAVCLNGQQDVGAQLVRRGGAMAYRRYSERYVPAETAAKSEGLGIWSGSMETPEAYRHKDDPAPAEASDGCRIKGNVGSGGGRVYHMPGQADYDATRIDPKKGEAWFCTEAEARAAGFRPAKR